MVPDAVCRVSVCNDSGPDVTDLALPAGLPVGLLIPAVVDTVRGAGSAGTHWHLARIGGTPLEESLTLAENDIHDGELLVLAPREVPVPRPGGQDVADTVAEAIPAAAPPHLGAAACLWAAITAAVALAWAGIAAAPTHLIAAATVSVAAGSAAVLACRDEHREPAAATLAVVAVVFAAAAGFLAVPAGPGAANSMLAAAAAAAVATVLHRVTGCATVALTAVAVMSAACTVTAAGAALWPVSLHAAGAVLAVVALGILGAAPRLAIALAGLTPSTEPGEQPPDGPDGRRARHGHALLTGLVAGSSAAAATATALIAAGALYTGSPWLSGLALTATVAAALLLRARTHPPGARRCALLASGTVSATACFVLFVVAVPDQAYWACGIAVGAGAAALWSTGGAGSNPVAHRAVDALEYLAVAALVPLACWVADVYGLAQGWASS